jgi:FkbM family methyltransferase
MYHRFKWTGSSRRRNGLTMEYEPLQPYFLLASIVAAKCKTFADIGSNIGAYSILMSQAPSLEKMVAFEANRSAADEMRANILLNSLDIDVRNVAVSDKNGSLNFGIVSRLAGNSAIVDTSEDQTFRRVEQAKCVTLDDALGACPGPFAIKIDVEGHEENVLRGARNLLENPCVVQVENYRETLEFPRGYWKVARIGPDWYYSNMDRHKLRARDLFEHASAMVIESNHERKSAAIHAGDFALSVSGRSYEMIKRVALRIFGSRL